MKKVKVDEIVIDGTTYVPKESVVNMAEKDGLPFVCVRTYSAGVHCGYLAKKEGKHIVLHDSIRIHYWDGAASLSQLAMEGVKKPGNCRFAIPVARIELTEAIEVIYVTEEARSNIQSVKSWTA